MCTIPSVENCGCVCPSVEKCVDTGVFLLPFLTDAISPYILFLNGPPVSRTYILMHDLQTHEVNYLVNFACNMFWEIFAPVYSLIVLVNCFFNLFDMWAVFAFT